MASGVLKFFTKINEAYEKNDGAELAECFLIYKPIFDGHVNEELIKNINNQYPSPWNEMISNYLLSLETKRKNSLKESFDHFSQFYMCFTRFFQSLKDDNWPLKIVETASNDLQNLSKDADKQNGSLDQSNKLSEKAADLLMAIFRVCVSDVRCPLEVSKKWAILSVVNELIRIYFRINKFQLCKPLIRAVDNLNIKDQFPIHQMITYWFLIGKKAMLDSNLNDAFDLLMLSFINCDYSSIKNKKIILKYLIPIAMNKGKFPKYSLLEKYGLQLFEPIIESIKNGDLLSFRKCLKENEEFFINNGIYLVIEKLTVLVYRNLFKKVYSLLQKHQIPIDAFFLACKYLEEPNESITSDEIECILCTLIYQGFIKGFISAQHKLLVVSKQNAFPLLKNMLQ